MTHPVSHIDHVALTVADLDTSVRFYVDCLGAVPGRGFEVDGVIAIRQIWIGSALLSLHQQGHTHPLVARKPTPGSGDLCFHWDAPIEDAIAMLANAGIAIVAGPIETFGSDGNPSTSVYFRDPDGNLLEFLKTCAISTGKDGAV